MASLPLTIKIDASEARAAIAECLEPGFYLLPAKAVRDLHHVYGLTEKELRDGYGAIGPGKGPFAKSKLRTAWENFKNIFVKNFK